MLRRFVALIAFLFLLAALPGLSQDTNRAPDLFERGMNAIRGGAQNRNDLAAIDYSHKSADLGYAPAQVALGYFYETGFSVAREPRRAADWYKKAAQQGDTLGAWLLGRIIYLGSAPPMDVNDAINWLERAPSNPYAQYLLGVIKLRKNDYARAAELFNNAAEQGVPQAQSELGKLLQQGAKDVPRDKFEAYVWLLMASDGGYGSPDLGSLEADLGTVRTEEAKSKARQRERQFSRTVNARGCTGWEGELDRIPAPPPVDIQQFCR